MIPATPIGMLFFLLAQAFSLLLDLIWLRHRAEQDKDVEILLLRQQLRILQRAKPLCRLLPSSAPVQLAHTGHAARR